MADAEAEPEPQVKRKHPIEKYGPKFVQKTEQLHDRAATFKSSHSNTTTTTTDDINDNKKKKKDDDDNDPPGGFDDTPIPYAPPGYTVKFTFHRAVNLPVADFNTLSSDPFLIAELDVDIPKRHRQDPDVAFRTRTARRDRNPEWNSEWIVANVPASGFVLKCYVYDEDPKDHDDSLGIAFLDVDSIDDGTWEGIRERSVRIKKRFASKRVYLFRKAAALVHLGRNSHAELVVSVECLGKTPGDNGGHIYTVGPNWWFRHYSALIGRIAGTKSAVTNNDGKKQNDRYNFQAIEMQLQGPVPPELYHRYVEFKPFVAGMFTSKSLRGRILNRALHHQHKRIYGFDQSTDHGVFPEPCTELTQKFLEFTHYGLGGRIFTYVLTLDGQFRFTETGKEFGIDLLSKHTMHSNVSNYIAYAGEFFLRRRRASHRSRRQSVATQPPHSSTEIVNTQDDCDAEAESDAPRDPAEYELFIDNDSGTYRPKADYLHLLRDFYVRNFPGLHVTTLDCQKDAERMQKLKDEQRECKKTSGQQMMYLQTNSTSSLSVSSSDEEELARRYEEAEETSRHGQIGPREHSPSQDSHGPSNQNGHAVAEANGESKDQTKSPTTTEQSVLSHPDNHRCATAVQR